MKFVSSPHRHPMDLLCSNNFKKNSTTALWILAHCGQYKCKSPNWYRFEVLGVIKAKAKGKYLPKISLSNRGSYLVLPPPPAALILQTHSVCIWFVPTACVLCCSWKLHGHNDLSWSEIHHEDWLRNNDKCGSCHVPSNKFFFFAFYTLKKPCKMEYFENTILTIAM